MPFHKIFLPIITTQRTAQGYFLSIQFVLSLSLPIKMYSSEEKSFLSFQDLTCLLNPLCGNYLQASFVLYKNLFYTSCEFAIFPFPLCSFIIMKTEVLSITFIHQLHTSFSLMKYCFQVQYKLSNLAPLFLSSPQSAISIVRGVSTTGNNV